MLGNLSKFSSFYNWDAILPKYTLIKQELEKCFAEINPGTFILAEHGNHKYMLMCLWLYLSERHKYGQLNHWKTYRTFFGTNSTAGIMVYNLAHLGMCTVSVVYKKGRNKTSKAFRLTTAETLDNFTGSSQVWTESTGK